MMLDWLGREKQNDDCKAASQMVLSAVDSAFLPGDLAPFELGGFAGTEEIATAVGSALESSKDA